MKIFYSWQMDAPRKTNKDFIRKALDEAVFKVSDEMDVSDAERDTIEVDQDTQGVLGSPDIARVILEKIAGSNLVVADVSLIGTDQETKRHINSNVAIELGYTYGKLGDEAVLKIMNTYFGLAEHLPFDLRVRRHPVQYSLEPGADVNTIKSVQKKLFGELTGILKQYVTKPPTPQENTHVETQSTFKRGAFWEPEDVLAPADPPYMHQNACCMPESLIYFRCIPDKKLPKLTSVEASNEIHHLWPLVSEGGYNHCRNKWGAISTWTDAAGDLLGFTQLLRNREIWGVDAYHSNITDSIERVGTIRFIPSLALQDSYLSSIDRILQRLKELQYGDTFTMEIGISGANGLHVSIGASYFSRFPGPIYEDVIFIRSTMEVDQPAGEILNAFWDKVFSEAGHPVPGDLVWTAPD